MPARCVQLADAVMQILQTAKTAGTLTLPVNPERAWAPAYVSDERKGWAIYVCVEQDPRETDQETRGVRVERMTIGVYVQRDVPSADPRSASGNAAIDEVAAMAELIHDFWETGTEAGPFTLIDVEHRPTIDRDTLLQKKVASSRVGLSFETT